MELEFAGQHDKSTYFKAVHWIHRPSRRDFIIRVGIYAVFAAFYAALVVPSFKVDGASALEFPNIVRHLIIFLVLAFLIFQPYLKTYQTAFRLWQDPVIRRKISGRVSPEGIQFDPSKEWTTWDQFVKVYKSPDLMVLLTISRMFITLPRSFFRDDNEWEMLQNMVVSQVKQVVE